MDDRSAYPRDVPAEQAYPDPNAQPNPAFGPFYTEAVDDSPAIQDIQDAADYVRQLAANGPPEPEQNDNLGYAQEDLERVSDQLRAEGHLHHQASPDHLSHGVLGLEEAPQPHYVPATNYPPTIKRTKVSRACDECRRKKIRCDALDIAEGEQCSPCKRASLECRYSRQPMKRGPSKGYIKELAARVNSLESQLGVSQAQPPQQQQEQQQTEPASIPEYAQPQDPYGELEQLRPTTPPFNGSRKRTHSVSEGSGAVVQHRDEPYAPARPAGMPWSPDASRQVHLPPPSAILQGLPQSAPQATPSGVETLLARSQQNIFTHAGWKYDAAEGVRTEPQNEARGSEPQTIDTNTYLDWDESVLDEYYRIIHGTFPLLPHSKSRLRARLAQCPATLRAAFFTAIDSSVRSSPSTSLAPSADVRQSTRRAAELIALSQYDHTSSRTPSAQYIYLQALILMALESDNHGPATMRGQVGPPRAEWLGRAVGMAAHLKLNIPRASYKIAEDEADSDENLGRRIWWILFILDRWHASSTSCLLQLADSSSPLLPEDKLLLGDSTYHLARLSFILGHVCQIQQSSLILPPSTTSPPISTTIFGEIESFRESVEALLLAAPNLVHLCYWHVRLLVLRLTPATTPEELLMPATRMASILNSSHTMITPLNHHFAALSAMTLCELYDLEETRSRAEAGIKDLVEALGSHRGLMSKENSTGWDGAITELVTGKFKQGAGAGPGSGLAVTGQHNGETSGEYLTGSGAGLVGLQHLADAATAGKRTLTSGAQNGVHERGYGRVPAQHGMSGRPVGSTAPYNPEAVVRFGYLAALVNEDSAQTRL